MGSVTEETESKFYTDNGLGGEFRNTCANTQKSQVSLIKDFRANLKC
jgi:hypothetical protein